MSRDERYEILFESMDIGPWSSPDEVVRLMG